MASGPVVILETQRNILYRLQLTEITILLLSGLNISRWLPQLQYILGPRDQWKFPPFSMMTSSNGNIFRVTDPLRGEFTGHRLIPRTKASGEELWCFLSSVPE